MKIEVEVLPIEQAPRDGSTVYTNEGPGFWSETEESWISTTDFMTHLDLQPTHFLPNGFPTGETPNG